MANAANSLLWAHGSSFETTRFHAQAGGFSFGMQIGTFHSLSPHRQLRKFAVLEINPGEDPDSIFSFTGNTDFLSC